MKSQYLVSVFRDDERTNLFFCGNFKNVDEVLDHLPYLNKSFLYNINKFKDKSRKNKYMDKYRRITIIKKTGDKSYFFNKSMEIKK